LKDVPNLFDCGLVILGIVDVVVSSPFDGVKSPVEDFQVRAISPHFRFEHFSAFIWSLADTDLAFE
jgi:hypothetical protein